MSKETGGSAFPYQTVYSGGITEYDHGMTLRDYFANSATEDDLNSFIPKTIGGVAELLLALGMIKPYGQAINAYKESDYVKLRYWAKYRHADAMLAERAK